MTAGAVWQSLGDDKFDFGGSFGSDDDEDEDFFTDKVHQQRLSSKAV